MRAIAVGEAAAKLDWLWPDAASLHLLACPLQTASWQRCKRDPAALLLLAATELHAAGRVPAFPVHQFRAINAVRHLLHQFSRTDAVRTDYPLARPALNPADATHARLLDEATQFARTAEAVARYTRACDPAVAWIGGMLAPLGWFAVASRDPGSVDEVLADPDYERHPLEAERELWGMDHSEIARRVCRRMSLPEWLTLLIGHLDLSIESIRTLGGQAELVAVVRIALEMTGRRGGSLHLMSRTHLSADLFTLQLDAADLTAIEARYREDDAGDSPAEWTDPRQVPLLEDYLHACLGERLLCGPHPDLIEQEVDRLHRIVHQQERTEATRLEDARVASLAEFAAGAAHEINNPLAVISGQAQYLLRGETESARRDSLHAIVRQVSRIHSILTDVMQFARPSASVRRPRGVLDDLQAALDQSRLLAEAKNVRLELTPGDPAVMVHLDPKQMQAVYAALLRNAIEASPQGGWVRLSVACTDDTVEVRFEDSGPGLDAEQRRHAFDPFYSGRSAGRGRGFGLPIAWRLARENGGEVRHQPRPGEPTLFVVRLPRFATGTLPVRQSA